MQVAEILSDLSTLYVCDHEAAMSLVSSHKDGHASSPEQVDKERPVVGKKNSGINTEGDVDLQRALDLSYLHGEMKEKHGKGAEMDEALQEARRKVTMVFRQVSAVAGAEA